MALSKTLSRGMRLSSRLYSSRIKDNLWTPDNIVVSPRKSISLPNITINEHIWNNLDKWADKTAVICGITRRNYSYHQIYKYSRNFAAHLRSRLGITDGDVVCIMMQNSPEYIISVLGILEAGAEMTTINPFYTKYEVQNQLKLSNPKIIIGSSSTISVLQEALLLMKKDTILINATDERYITEGTVSFGELLEDIDHLVLRDVKRNSDDISLLPYSSGTTGLPKGVELTHKNIVVNCLQNDAEGLRHYHDSTESHQDSVMAVLPFYHIYGLSIVMLHKLSVGAKIVTLPSFQPDTFLTALETEKVSILYAVPPIVLFLGSHQNVTNKHLDSIQTILSGAAPIPIQDIHKTLSKTRASAQFTQVYGLTETSPLVTINFPGSNNYSSAGFSVPNTEMKIVDSNMNALGPNETGELLIRGPQVMKGYRNNPEATNNAITPDGWFKSGDLCTLHEDGSLTVADRLKELIKVKGFQVPPAELEYILKGHSAILDAGVVAIPDQRTGEAPKAFIVLKDGQKADAKEILDFVNNRVSEFKRLKDVVILDSLPKNPSGKLLRRILKEKYC